jgi:integrase
MAVDKGDRSIYLRCSRKGPGHETGDHGQCTITDWVGQVENGRYPNGRRRYACVVRKTKAEVRQALKDLQGNVDARVTPDKTRTVATYLDWWADEVLPTTGVSAETVQRYKWVIGKHLKPHIGKVRLAVLAPTHVQAMLTKLERQGLAPRTRSQVRTILRRALAWVEHTGGLVARSSAAAVDGPRLGGSKIDDRLSASQVKAVLAVAARRCRTTGGDGHDAGDHRACERGDRIEALAVLALRLGLRRGEALAMKWTDVDLDTKTLKVIDAKTPSGKRTIPLVAGTAAALREHRRRRAAGRWHPLAR